MPNAIITMPNLTTFWPERKGKAAWGDCSKSGEGVEKDQS
jgi:hypothetical protein